MNARPAAGARGGIAPEPLSDSRAATAELRAPLLGEWACLGILCGEPAHGWAVARRLGPAGDIGRIWQLSRPLTYRALEQLGRRGWAHAVGEEPGEAGPNRTILAATNTGRSQFQTWLRTPVEHLRDLRSELLVKLVLAEQLDVDIGDMLHRQQVIVDAYMRLHRDDGDVVDLWRHEATEAAWRFLEQVIRRRAQG